MLPTKKRAHDPKKIAESLIACLLHEIDASRVVLKIKISQQDCDACKLKLVLDKSPIRLRINSGNFSEIAPLCISAQLTCENNLSAVTKTFSRPGGFKMLNIRLCVLFAHIYLKETLFGLLMPYKGEP